MTVGVLGALAKSVDGMWGTFFGHREIVVTPECLFIRNVGFLFTGSESFEADTIEEVLPVQESGTLVIRSDERMLSVQAGCDAQELAFIISCIRHVFCS
jgi:hypothetical protein